MICAIHGTGGEDGSLLGALELSGMPYVGGGVGRGRGRWTSALGKLVFREAGVEVGPHTLIRRGEFTRRPRQAALRRAGEQGMPCYVKPASLGSSIGVGARHGPGGARGGARALLRARPDGARRARARRVRRGERRDPRRPRHRAARLGGRAAGARRGGRAVVRGQVPARRRGKGRRGARPRAAAPRRAAGSEGMASADRLIPAPISDTAARGARGRRQAGAPRARLRSAWCATTSSSRTRRRAAR